MKANFKDSLSVDDIHRLRECHYEETKGLSGEELIKEINGKAEGIRKKIAQKKKQKLTA